MSNIIAALEAQIQSQQPTYEDTVTQLAVLKSFEYDRVRVEKAKSLNVRQSTLDADVKTARQESVQGDLPFTDIDPYQEQINPAELLDDITATILRFIVLDKYQAQLAALWVSACLVFGRNSRRSNSFNQCARKGLWENAIINRTK